MVVSLVCEMLTSISLCRWNQEFAFISDPTNDHCWCNRMCALLRYLQVSLIGFCINPVATCFVADLCFSLAKLFPGIPYNCDSWSCRKVTHTCAMTLCAFPFQMFELRMLRRMVKQQVRAGDGRACGGSKVPVLLKIVEFSANLAFVLYDAATLDPRKFSIFYLDNKK